MMTANVKKNSGTQSADKALCKKTRAIAVTRDGAGGGREPRAETCLARAHDHDGPVVLPRELEQPKHTQRLEHRKNDPKELEVKRHDREEIAPQHDVAHHVQEAL